VAFRQAVEEFVASGKIEVHDLVACAGIGCHGKISDYINVNSFTSLHGRAIPTMTGIKCANPNLTVVGFSGDGDTYSEGLEHVIAAARRNSDIKLFVHDNQVFALTAFQATSVSPKGFKSKSTPFGSIEEPFNPLLTILSAGATFVARTYAGDIAGTKKIMQAAIAHKGFSYVDIIQPCLTFFDTRNYFKEKNYWLDEKFPSNDFSAALEILSKPQKDGKVALGVFYNVTKSTFEEQLLATRI
jgi:2-oxoglutarate ferredoxin oxidoreductase subunit beta